MQDIEKYSLNAELTESFAERAADVSGEEESHSSGAQVGFPVVFLVYSVHLRVCVQVTNTCRYL